MALIIAIGHGANTDPFTTSTDSQPSDDISKVEDCLSRIQEDKFPDSDFDTVITWVDEILVVENDEVVQHFSWEDGLGEQLDEEEEDDIDDVDVDDDFLDEEDDDEDE